MNPRRIVWFSCGAASAVAAHIYLRQHPDALVCCINIQEEHHDSLRFRQDVARWLGVEIHQIADTKYSASIYEVFRRSRFLVGPRGAACTRLLKKAVRESFQLPGDIHVFGFTVEEQDRFDRLIDANNISVEAPLIDHGLSKADCLGYLQRVGIPLPQMYRLGFSNNNCVGCVKGGAGYWNRVRVHFPEVFDRMSAVETDLQRTILHVPLSQLEPNAGRHDDVVPDCSIFCELALESIA